MTVDLFATILLADITAPKHWDTKFLIAHLSQRFEYIIKIPEASPARWLVAVWSRPYRPRSDDVSIRGEVESPGWTDADMSLDQACAIARDASAALHTRFAIFIVAFYPFDWWRTQARQAQGGESRRLVGVA